MASPFETQIKQSIKIGKVQEPLRGKKITTYPVRYVLSGNDRNDMERSFKALFEHLNTKKNKEFSKENGYEIITENDKTVSRTFTRVIRFKNKNDKLSFQFIVKPEQPGRVSYGLLAEQKISKWIKLLGGKNTVSYPSDELFETGGSTSRPDVKCIYNGKTLQFEVKTAQRLREISFFDKTMWRISSGGKSDLSIIDGIFQQLKGMTFEKYIDYIREKDQTVGYPGDPGVTTTSGSLPKEHFSFVDKKEIFIILKAVRDHWISRGDQYFIVTDRNSSDCLLYSTGATRNSYFEERVKELFPRAFAGSRIPVFNSAAVQEIYFANYGGSNRIGAIRVKISYTPSNARYPKIENMFAPFNE